MATSIIEDAKECNVNAMEMKHPADSILYATRTKLEYTSTLRWNTLTDLYKYSPDAVPPIQYLSSHVATDKDPSK